MNTFPREPDILLVDDDLELADMLCDYLRNNGCGLRHAADGQAMDVALAQSPPDLLLLDIMLPGEDGLSLTRRLRAKSDIPIIILSARGDTVDRVVGLELGGDDYLAKPFDPRELLARIRSLLRRHRSPGAAESQSVDFGPYRLLHDERRLLGRDGEITLTTGEFDLLAVFARHPRRVLSRDALVTLVQGDERLPFDRSIDVRVTRLRRKIEPDPAHPVYIRTVRGIGYLFAPRGGDDALD